MDTALSRGCCAEQSANSRTMCSESRSTQEKHWWKLNPRRFFCCIVLFCFLNNPLTKLGHWDKPVGSFGASRWCSKRRTPRYPGERHSGVLGFKRQLDRTRTAHRFVPVAQFSATVVLARSAMGPFVFMAVEWRRALLRSTLKSLGCETNHPART